MFEKKTVLITGCSSGMGRAAAKYFQAKGWCVAATVRRSGDVKELNQLAAVVCPVLDVGKPESIKAAVDLALDAFGQIDVLVNNAGYGLLGPFEAATEEQIARQFDTNLVGTIRLIKAVLPHLRQHRSGVIVNLSSISGRIGFPYYSLYAATKWGIEGLSESLYHELRPFGIRVKLIEPGPVDTDFFIRSAVYAKQADLTDYDKYANRVYAQMKGQRGRFVVSPQEAARVIYRAATDKSSRLRYTVGKIAPLLLAARFLFPDFLFFRLLQTRWGA